MHVQVMLEMANIYQEIEYVFKIFYSITNIKFRVITEKLDLDDSKPTIFLLNNSKNRTHYKSRGVSILIDTDFWEKYLRNEKSEIGIRTYEDLYILCSNKDKTFLDVDNDSIQTNFDIISSAFIILSRYEEIYSSYRPDEHGRYKLSSSLITSDMLKKPIVEFYAIFLCNLLQKCFNEKFFLKEKGITAVITHDIDRPFYYLSLKSELSTLKKYLFSSNYNKFLSHLFNYVCHLISIRKDQYDTFNLLMECENKHGILSTYFILLSDDNKWGLKVKKLKKRLAKLIKNKNEIALHPGYKSFNKKDKIKYEKTELENIAEVDIVGIRNHFLRLNYPETYRVQASAGIQYDSTMSYAENEGYRSGISIPYMPFDIENRCIINLMVIPLTIMDGTFRDYHKISSEQAMPIIKKLIDQAEQLNGTVVFNWHNNFISNHQLEWRNIYLESISYLIEKKTSFKRCIDIANDYRNYWN